MTTTRRRRGAVPRRPPRQTVAPRHTLGDNGSVSPDDILSVAEAAAELDLAKNNVLAWIMKGRLKATKIGRSWVIRRGDLEDFRAWWKGNVRAVASKKPNS